MSRAGRTKKPCHGCGTTGQDSEWPDHWDRPTAGVCDECQKKLDAHDGLAAQAAVKEDEVVLLTPRHSPLGRLAGKVDGVRSARVHVGFDTCRRWDKVSLALVTALGREGHRGGHYGESIKQDGVGYDERMLDAVGDRRDGHNYPDQKLLPRDVADALVEFRLILTDVLNDVATSAYESGSSLLHRLAAGEVSVTDLNALSVGGENEENDR